MLRRRLVMGGGLRFRLAQDRHAHLVIEPGERSVIDIERRGNVAEAGTLAHEAASR
jgi:hypothetical protein